MKEHEGIPGSHDWGHVERVMKLCLHIGRKEGGNRDVLELAAILHDIGRLKKYKNRSPDRCHAKTGAKVARGILKKYNIKGIIAEKIIHCIEAHRFRGEKSPEILEARILFDADKLDSIGAVGIGRDFMFASEIGSKFHNSPNVNILKTRSFTKEDTAYREYIFKLRHVYKRMMTREGKLLARERHLFMMEFFKRLLAEIKGRK